MRYTVKYWDGKNIINDLQTNELAEAVKRELKLRKIYGRGNAWYADAVLELLVG